FMPQLYASSALLDSLGQLLLNAVLILWLVVFVVRHAPYDNWGAEKLPAWSKMILAVMTIISIVLCSFAYINIVSSLITDSNISFDVSHFYTISSYTIIGLLIVAIISTTAFIVTYLLSVQLKMLLPNKWQKYLLLTL